MNLNDLFIGWYDYSKKDYEKVLKKGLISFDTNVLLNMYRFSTTTASETFSALANISDRIVTSHYVLKEFTKNRKKVKIDNIRDYENLSRNIEEKIIEINDLLSDYSEKKLSNINEILEILDNSKVKILNSIKDEKDLKSKFYISNDIETNIANIFLNNVTFEYSEEIMKEINEEGLKRVTEKIPPGYMDSDKPENGDYVIFKSLIDYSKEKKRDLLFVTNDKKEDWFRNISGIKEPREELLEEFYRETGFKLIIMDFDHFIKNDLIFVNKFSEDAVNEIIEINKSQEKNNIRGFHRIQRHLFYIIKYSNINDVKNNKEDVLKYLRTAIRICEGIQDLSLFPLLQKMHHALFRDSFDEYFMLFSLLNSKVKKYKSDAENHIKELFMHFSKLETPELGLVLLDNISDYLKDYTYPSFDNRILLSRCRELKVSKRNKEVDDIFFINEVKSLYDSFVGDFDQEEEIFA